MTPMAATPDPPDSRFPVYDPFPHPLDLLACWLVPALGDPHWSGPPCCVLDRTGGVAVTAPRRLARSSSPPISAWNNGNSNAPLADGLIPGPGRSRGRWPRR